MSLSPTTPNFAQVARSFWDRPEGKWGKGIIIAGVVGVAAVVVFFWGLILPFLIGVVGNTIQLAGLVGVLGVLTSPIWSSSVRLAVRNAFQLSVRWGYHALIAKDPIGMLRNNRDEMAKEVTVFEAGVSQLAGSKQRLESDIQAQKDTILHNKNLSDATDRKIAEIKAKAANLTGNDRQEAALNIQQLTLAKQGYLQAAGIANQTIQTEQPILDQTNRMYDQLYRLLNLARFKVSALGQQADMYAKQRATILASQKALGAAGRIIKGDPQQLAIVDQTIEYLNNETADTIGAMKDFNRNSEKYLTDMDVQNDASASAAQKLFDQLENKLNVPDPLAGALSSGTVTGVTLTSVTPNVDYSELLK